MFSDLSPQQFAREGERLCDTGNGEAVDSFQRDLRRAFDADPSRFSGAILERLSDVCRTIEGILRFDSQRQETAQLMGDLATLRTDFGKELAARGGAKEVGSEATALAEVGGPDLNLSRNQ